MHKFSNKTTLFVYYSRYFIYSVPFSVLHEWNAHKQYITTKNHSSHFTNVALSCFLYRVKMFIVYFKKISVQIYSSRQYKLYKALNHSPEKQQLAENYCFPLKFMIVFMILSALFLTLLFLRTSLVVFPFSKHLSFARTSYRVSILQCPPPSAFALCFHLQISSISSY